jgi:hypothetical protein
MCMLCIQKVHAGVGRLAAPYWRFKWCEEVSRVNRGNSEDMRSYLLDRKKFKAIDWDIDEKKLQQNFLIKIRLEMTWEGASGFYF